MMAEKMGKKRREAATSFTFLEDGNFESHGRLHLSAKMPVVSHGFDLVMLAGKVVRNSSMQHSSISWEDQ